MTKIFRSLRPVCSACTGRPMPLLAYGIILMLLLCTIAFAKEELKIGMDAPDFALKDAEDKDYKLKEMQGDVVILIMGNSKTRKETDKWAKAIKKDYSKYEEPPSERSKSTALEHREGLLSNEVKGLKIFIIADMRGAPRFVPRGFIKGWLRMNKPPATLLLDWDGKTHIAYKTQKRKPNVFIINKTGKIAYRINANYDDETYKKVKAGIERSLAESSNELKSEK